VGVAPFMGRSPAAPLKANKEGRASSTQAFDYTAWRRGELFQGCGEDSAQAQLGRNLPFFIDFFENSGILKPMKTLLSCIISAGLGLWLAAMFVPGVLVQALPNSSFFGFSLTAQWELLILFGIIIGLLNFFVKPVLDLITLPLRILTLGLVGFIISMGMIWVVDYMFAELSVPLLYPLLWTTVIITMLNILLSQSVLKKND
jgi:putative membrane protein